jgi:hypothetical protein
VKPAGGYLELSWLFASEEFGAYDGKFNDMALVLADTGWSGSPANPADKNCAWIDPGNGTRYPATVAVIHDALLPIRSDADANLTSLWGSTDPRICRIHVVPGETVTLRLVVFDVSDGNNDSALLLGAGTLRSDLPPTPALAASPGAGSAPLHVNLSTAGSSDDRSIASWQVGFGDGSTAETGTGPPPSTIAHDYTAPGPYTATLTTTDDLGQTASASAPVTVSPPAAAAASGPGPGGAGAMPLAHVGKPRLGAPSKVTLKQARAGVPVTLACEAACSHKVVLTLDRKLAKRLGIKGKRVGGRIVIGSAGVKLASAGSRSARLKVSRAVARRLGRTRAAKVKLMLALTGLPGVSRGLTLRPH